jgi:hypothetical protein
MMLWCLGGLCAAEGGMLQLCGFRLRSLVHPLPPCLSQQPVGLVAAYVCCQQQQCQHYHAVCSCTLLLLLLRVAGRSPAAGKIGVDTCSTVGCR